MVRCAASAASDMVNVLAAMIAPRRDLAEGLEMGISSPPSSSSTGALARTSSAAPNTEAGGSTSIGVAAAAAAAAPAGGFGVLQRLPKTNEEFMISFDLFVNLV